MKRTSRLGHWTGRRRSSRSGEPFWHALGCPYVLARLSVVLVTAVVVTTLACLWGFPLPYRVGEVFPHDLRARVDFEVVDQPQTDRAREDAIARLSPAERQDPAQREQVRSETPVVTEKYPQGIPLAQRGEPITVQQFVLLREENRAFQDNLDHGERLTRFGSLFLVLTLLSLLLVLYVARFQPTLAQSLPRITGVCALVVGTLALAMLLNQAPWHASLVPLTVTAMVLTLTYNPQFALLLSFSLALSISLCLGTDRNLLLVQTGGLATAILLLRNVRTRTRLVEIGVASGVAYLAMSVAVEMLSGQTWKFIAFDASRRFLWGALSGFLVSGCLPLVERWFGVLTDISLLELADGSHPLLQELLKRAPGTYTHSMTVATLAEPAAEEIGVDSLLVRVGCYFHDVGKMLKPHYFVENQTGENRHDELEPALSTLVIIGHVKDGVALGEQYHLPRPVLHFIQQHHGTTLVEYFYQEARRLQEANGHPRVELEASFRYPGPKPQSREIALMMLADGVESASRALDDPSPSSLRKLVHDLAMKRLLDGQLEESGLTLTELHRIEESLSKSLIALFHARIKYPDAKERELAS